MKETNYWQQFMSTGSISDYLNYRNECGDTKDDASVTQSVGSMVRDLGVNSYAGVCSSNRNNIEDGACR